MTKWLLAVLLTGMVPQAFAESVGGVELLKRSQHLAFTHSMDVRGFNPFSLQVDYADSEPAAAVLSDGNLASATLTVADFSALDGRASSATITIVDGKNTEAAIGSALILINGRSYREGVHWALDADTSTMTAKNLRDAIDAYVEYSATVSSNVVTVTAASIGTYANAWTITSSTQAALTATPFVTGQNAGWLSVNLLRLTEGTDFDAETSSDTTANNIEDAINGHAGLSSIITASNTAMGVVTLSAVANGINAHSIVVSDDAALVRSANRLAGGAASDISVAADTFSKSAHGFGSAMAVLFSTGGASAIAPTGLTDQTTYFVRLVDANTFQVSESSSSTGPGAAVDITALNGGETTLTFTPLAFSAGSAGFDFRGSNDNLTYYDLTGTSIGGVVVSSVSYAADGGALFNFTNYPYRYIRLNVVGPTDGGLNMDVTFNGSR